MSLEDMYNYYNIMKFYGNYTIFEVDDMYPFEREIYHGLLLDTRKKQLEH